MPRSWPVCARLVWMILFVIRFRTSRRLFSRDGKPSAWIPRLHSQDSPNTHVPIQRGVPPNSKEEENSNGERKGQ